MDQGLVPFDISVHTDRQILNSVGGRKELLTDLTLFIYYVVDGPGDFLGEDVLEVLQSPEYKNLSWSDIWMVKTFKKVASALGYKINPDRDRYQKDLKGVPEEWFRIDTPVPTRELVEGFCEVS